MWICFIALTACIICRGIEAGRFPVANLYESLVWFAWAIIGGYLWLGSKYDIDHLGWMVNLAVTIFFLYASWLPADQHSVRPLMPALVSFWRQIHVPPLIISYALFLIAGVASLAQLWHTKRLQAVLFSAVALFIGLGVIALGTFTQANVNLLRAVFALGSGGALLAAWFGLGESKPSDSAVKLARVEGEIADRCISVGVPLLTIGIVTGALWANHAWGTYWSWDPKETMSLVTWLGYSLYLHLRIKPGFPPEKLSLIAVAAMMLTLLTYLGFNALGFGGMHGYGSVK
jgi:cytochrome c-type biogenesis protein CcsB